VEEIYPVPVTVSVCEGEPARTLAGEMDVIAGVGLFAGATGGDTGAVGEEGELLPLQPTSKEKARVDPTNNRTLRRTSPPRKTKDRSVERPAEVNDLRPVLLCFIGSVPIVSGNRCAA
jgi:hypothetical protein